MAAKEHIALVWFDRDTTQSAGALSGGSSRWCVGLEVAATEGVLPEDGHFVLQQEEIFNVSKRTW